MAENWLKASVSIFVMLLLLMLLGYKLYVESVAYKECIYRVPPNYQESTCG